MSHSSRNDSTTTIQQFELAETSSLPEMFPAIVIVSPVYTVRREFVLRYAVLVLQIAVRLLSRAASSCDRALLTSSLKD
jgi:hypothetical protein